MARRRTPVFSAIDDGLVSSGLQLDRHTLKRALWEVASGVTFWNGQVRRKRPTSRAYTGSFANRIAGLGQQFQSNGSRWIWSAVGNVGTGVIDRWQFGAPSLALLGSFGTYVDNATATERPTIVDFTPYGDWMIANPTVAGQRAWRYVEGAGWDQPADWPAGVTKYLKFMSFLVALGYGTRGTQVGWSDANNILVFTPTTSNTAGSLSIDEFNTPIRAGCRLGDSLAVYSEDQLAKVSYVGAPFIMGQKTVIDGIGAIGKAAVASDTRINVGLGRAGAWWTDGNSFRYIDEGHLANYFQENINWDQAAKAVVARNDFTGCFDFSFPKGDELDNSEGWSWDPNTGGWSPIPAFDMMDERRLFNYPIQGFNDGEVHLSEFENPLTQQPLVLETKPLVMSTAESPHVVTRVDEIDLLLHAAEHVEFRIGSCDEPLGDYEWTEFMPVEAGARVEALPDVPEAPYWKLGFRNDPAYDAEWDIDLQGFLMYGVTVGSKMDAA